MLGIGVLGALIMFVADLVLYFPTAIQDRSAESYFTKVDPGGSNLSNSTMSRISHQRVMCGGAMGPVSAVFIASGMRHSFFGLQQQEEVSSLSLWTLVLPIISSVGLALSMTIGSSYHAVFVYTCFLSKEIAKYKKESTNDAAAETSLLRILSMHQTYLKYLFKWAAVSMLTGSIAFLWCCFSRENILYAPWTVAFVPAFSGVVKKVLKRNNIGNIVLVGGLTNIWNACFFIALSVSLVMRH